MAEISEERLLRLLGGIDALPTLPPVIAELTSLLGNPNTSAAQITELVSEDQAMTAKILKLANSAYYGFPSEVATIKQAVVLLGFSSIRDVALSASVVDIFKASLKQQGGRGRFDLVRFWEHSIGVAVASRILAKRLDIAEAEELFVLGLVHDMPVHRSRKRGGAVAFVHREIPRGEVAASRGHLELHREPPRGQGRRPVGAQDEHRALRGHLRPRAGRRIGRGQPHAAAQHVRLGNAEAHRARFSGAYLRVRRGDAESGRIRRDAAGIARGNRSCR